MAAEKKRFSCWRVGGCLLVILGMLAALAYLLNPPHPRSYWRQKACRSNVRQLGLASQVYAYENEQRLPSVHDWPERLRPNLRNDSPALFHCPSAPETPNLSYGMNHGLDGIIPTSLSSNEQINTPVYFDGRGAFVIERHDGGANYSFLDGRAEWLEHPPAGIHMMSEDQ